MPLTVPFQMIYAGELARPMAKVVSFRSGVTGLIRSFRLWAEGGISGTWHFNCRVNGAGQWSGDDRLTVTAGDLDDSVLSQAVAVSLGDTVDLDLEDAAGGILSAVYFLIETEEV
jgi:hypothetical protein